MTDDFDTGHICISTGPKTELERLQQRLGEAENRIATDGRLIESLLSENEELRKLATAIERNEK